MFDEFNDLDEDLLDPDESSASSVVAPSLYPPRENPDVFGHESVEKQILDLFEKKTLPHAMIFSGPMGVGKTTTAFRVARFLLSQKGDEEESGGLFGPEEAPAAPITTLYIMPDNPTFARVASGGHPDLRYIERPLDEKKGTRKGAVDVESVRAITPFLRMKSADGGWRVVIVDEADLMNRNAQNTILKILEEPPPKALLILICNRLGAMLPTIRSRCRTFSFQPLQPADMAMLLKRAMPGAGQTELALLTAMADGSPGRAIALHEQGGIETVSNIVGLLSGWPHWDWTKIHAFADNAGRAGADSQYRAFEQILVWLCETLLLTRAAPDSRKLPQILENEAIAQLQTHYSLEQWTGICDKLKDHFLAIEQSNLDKRQGVIGAFAILGQNI